MPAAISKPSYEDLEKGNPEYVLRGKTLQVYLYLLRHNGYFGVSEIQRALGFSSPSLVSHHIDKLILLGIVSKDENGRFMLQKTVDVSILREFGKIGSIILPRFAFYLGVFLVIAIAYIWLNISSLNVIATAGITGSVVSFAYETWRVWKKRPF